MPYILTLKLDPHTFTTLNTLRRAHFPAARNFIPAHITLFHALPGEKEPAIRHTLQAHSRTTAPMQVSCSAVRFLGQGVAITVDAPELCTLRAQLAADWQHWLNAQNRHIYQPHVTVQNKVTNEAARALFDQLSQAWHPFSGIGAGLCLWRYLKGPWEHIAEFMFGRVAADGSKAR